MLLPTPATLKSLYMFGIPLTDENGNEYPDANLQKWIDVAVDWMEVSLQIKLRPTFITEKHDYNVDEYVQYGLMNLYQYPVIRIESLQAVYGGMPIFTFPSEWLQLSKACGQLHVTPTSGNLSNILMGRGSSEIFPLLAIRLSYYPGLFEVKYWAGFDETVYEGLAQPGGLSTQLVVDPANAALCQNFRGASCYFLDGPMAGESVGIIGYNPLSRKAKLERSLSHLPVGYNYELTVSEIPANICDLVAMKACCGIMNVLGDILLGAGIASQSISMDGLSESIGTTQSAEFGAYSARVTAYTKQIAKELPALVEHYKGLRMIVA